MRRRVRFAALLPLFVLAQVCGGHASAQMRVVSVVTNTGEAHDAARFGDDTLVATDGGLAILRGDGTSIVLGAHAGMPGARLRSVSVVGDEVYVGGVEGTVVMRLGDDGALRIVRRLPLRRVRRVLRFGETLVAASFGDGLFRIPAEGRPTRVRIGRSHARKRITSLLVVDDQLWVATAGAGVIRLGADLRIVGRLNRRTGLGSDFVFAMARHADLTALATMSGLDVVRGHTPVAAHSLSRAAASLPIRDLRAVVSTGDGLLVGSYGGGVSALREDVGASPASSSGLRVHTMREDGQRYLVAHTGGLHALDGEGETELLGQRMPSSDVTAMARAFGKVFVGTFGHGLGELRGGRVRPIERATSRWGVDRRINDLARVVVAGRERLYIATDRGLYWHDGRRFVPVEDPHAPGRVHVTSLHVAPDGALWVTSSRMLSRLRAGTWRSFTGDSRFPVMQLHAVTIDGRGRTWVGSLHGLYRLDENTGTFERYTVSSGHLPVDWVTALIPTANGVVAGTYHGGLARVHVGDDGAVRSEIEYERRGGLPSGWVNPHAMRRVGERLLIGTLEGGLVVGQRGAWRRFTTRDGLPSDDVTDTLPNPDGTLWVATRGGIARVRLR